MLNFDFNYCMLLIVIFLLEILLKDCVSYIILFRCSSTLRQHAGKLS